MPLTRPPRSVFTRTKNDPVSIGRQGDRRKHPLFLVGTIIGQRPPSQRHRRRTAVEQLQPVRRIQFFVFIRIGIAGDKFCDNRPARRNQGRRSSNHTQIIHRDFLRGGRACARGKGQPVTNGRSKPRDRKIDGNILIVPAHIKTLRIPPNHRGPKSRVVDETARVSRNQNIVRIHHNRPLRLPRRRINRRFPRHRQTTGQRPPQLPITVPFRNSSEIHRYPLTRRRRRKKLERKADRQPTDVLTTVQIRELKCRRRPKLPVTRQSQRIPHHRRQRNRRITHRRAGQGRAVIPRPHSRHRTVCIRK